MNSGDVAALTTTPSHAVPVGLELALMADVLARVLIGMTLFTAAYLAEVVRAVALVRGVAIKPLRSCHRRPQRRPIVSKVEVCR